MGEQRIDPAKITKPIQLLAAWLIGLILTNALFLTAASKILKPEWASSALVIASIVNVPIFLACLFLLQTKFRPEMQEDEFYARYLEKHFSNQTGKTEIVAVSSRKTIATHPISTPIRWMHINEKDYKIGHPLRPDEISEDISVEINDLLPSYKELIEAIFAEGIIPRRTFGSTSIEPTTPKHFIISLGKGIPLSFIQKIIRIASRYGLEGIVMAGDDDDEPMHFKRIYIGAYSYDDPNSFIHLDSNMLDRILSTDMREPDFYNLIKR